MKFCHACPSDTNCCTSNTVDLPLLTSKDIARIGTATGLSSDDFSSQTSGTLRQMKAGDEGCLFYQAGRCGIYDSRPTDCRMFPFDIDRDDNGRLVWIVYSSTCAVPIDSSKHFAQVQKLAQELEPHIADFATQTSARMEGHDCQILGPVEPMETDCATGRLTPELA